ncbi:MAG TPA: hypothetical protein VFK73_02070, partial [Paludibacter sp.]|nr:hypothetical protein [Paludibacter sp.]
MRKITFFKMMLVAIGLLVASVSTKAQLLLEPFNYSVDATNGLAKQSAGIWKKINSGDSILIESGNLSYSGLPTSTGN